MTFFLLMCLYFIEYLNVFGEVCWVCLVPLELFVPCKEVRLTVNTMSSQSFCSN